MLTEECGVLLQPIHNMVISITADLPTTIDEPRVLRTIIGASTLPIPGDIRNNIDTVAPSLLNKLQSYETLQFYG